MSAKKGKYMGLDMYLNKRIYIGNKWRVKGKHNAGKGLVKVSIPKTDKDIVINNKRISEITEEVGYWRKANAIHYWFVNNVQDGEDNCADHYIQREQLEELLKLCKKVKAVAKLKTGKVQNGTINGVPNMEDGKFIENAEEVAELLPTQSGFFFGSTDYNEYYYQDILDTIDILENILKEPDNGSFYYSSSW